MAVKNKKPNKLTESRAMAPLKKKLKIFGVPWHS